MTVETALYATPSDSLDDLEEHTVNTASESALKERNNHPDWFTESEDTLISPINSSNESYK
jgi:hypothetical protein